MYDFSGILTSTFFIKIVSSWRRYFMTHDVIDNVARLVFLLYTWFRHYALYQCLVRSKGVNIHTQDG